MRRGTSWLGGVWILLHLVCLVKAFLEGRCRMCMLQRPRIERGWFWFGALREILYEDRYTRTYILFHLKIRKWAHHKVL